MVEFAESDIHITLRREKSKLKKMDFRVVPSVFFSF